MRLVINEEVCEGCGDCGHASRTANTQWQPGVIRAGGYAILLQQGLLLRARRLQVFITTSTSSPASTSRSAKPCRVAATSMLPAK